MHNSQPVSRRIVLGGLLATPFLIRPGFAAAQATPTGLSSTPVNAQLAWLLALFQDGARSLTTEAFIAHYAPPQDEVAEQFVSLMKSVAEYYGPLTLAGFSRLPTPFQANALVRREDASLMILSLAVEAESPHRITADIFTEIPEVPSVPLTPAYDVTGTSISDTERHDSLIDIDGRQIYLSSVGTGGPTVVLESDLVTNAAPWFAVESGVATFARVVTYDRPNSRGASDTVSSPITADDAVADLHAMLTTAGVPGPYVLVGHGFGGIITRLYASTYPDEVAGLVLVDAMHEDQLAYVEAAVSPEEWAEYWGIFTQFPNPEGIDIEASFALTRRARLTAPLRPMPLSVISAGKPDAPAISPLNSSYLLPDAAMERVARELRADLAGLAPRSRSFIAEQSGHDLHETEPELVIDAIRQVVAAVRDPGTWEKPVASTPLPAA